jgi:amicoumacin kinase
MEKRIRDLYSDGILRQSLEFFEVQSPEDLGGFENYIYKVSRGENDHILRIGHDLHRDGKMVSAEIEWLNYLYRSGVRVPQADQRVAHLPAADGSQFHAVLLEKLAGHSPRREDWENGLTLKLGMLLGQMNRLTCAFTPADPEVRRPQWYAEQVGFAEKFLPASENLAVEKYNQLLARLFKLPTPPDAFGLIHQDAHGGNFFLQDDGQIALFDFDDCHYSWFAQDIAMAFFYMLPHDCRTEAQLDSARRVLEQLLAGYNKEYTLEPRWLEEIPTFLKLREIDLYVAIHRSLDLNNLDPWCASFMANRKQKIENDQPYADIF